MITIMTSIYSPRRNYWNGQACSFVLFTMDTKDVWIRDRKTEMRRGFRVLFPGVYV